MKWFFLLATIIFWSSPVLAECALIGTLVRVDVADEGREGIHTLYFREAKIDPHYYVFKTTNQLIASAAFSLVAMQTRVELVGSEDVCPTDGQVRFPGFVRRLTVTP